MTRHELEQQLAEKKAAHKKYHPSLPKAKEIEEQIQALEAQLRDFVDDAHVAESLKQQQHSSEPPQSPPGGSFGSDGGDMNIAQDQATAIQIGELHLHGQHAGSGDGPPCQLPPLDAYFVGRERELAQLVEELQPGRVLAICGPGGIGKSALAARAVHALEPERFPDGVFFHSFYGQPDPNIALEQIALSFGEEPKPNPALAAQRALAGKRALLLLDGTEEAEDLGAVLKVRGECGVLITSRRKHDALDIRHDLAPLDEEQAEELLQSWGKLPSNDPASPRICALVGGLPLAIRLIGHYLDETGETPAEYLEWLEQQPFEALDRGEHRIESVNVLLERSTAQVSESAKQALTVVGLLALTPFGVEPLAAALDCEIRPCRSALGELVEYGLLLRETDQRYSVTHALVHTYARQQLHASYDTLAALAQYYTNFAKEQSAKGLAGYAKLDSERPHILHLLERCRAQQQWPPVSALVGAINTYLNRQGYWTERQTALTINLEASRELEDRQYEGWCLRQLGHNAHLRGDYTAALEYNKQGLVIQQDIGDKAGEGRTLNNLGWTYDAQGDYGTALRYYEQSLVIRKEIGHKAGEGTTLSNIGAIAYAYGDYARALQYLEQSLAIQQDIGDKTGEGRTLNNIGNIYCVQGDYTRALQYLEQSLAIQQKIGAKAMEGTTLNNISQIYKIQGDYARALSYLGQSLVIAQELGNKAGEGLVLNNFSQIYQDWGGYVTALQYLEQSLAIYQEIGDKTGEGTTLSNIGNIYGARSDYARALQYLEQSLTIHQELGYIAGQCPTLFNIGLIFAEHDDLPQALLIWIRAYRIARSLNLAEALNALEGLAEERELPGGLEGWERFSNRIEQEIGEADSERDRAKIEQIWEELRK